MKVVFVSLYDEEALGIRCLSNVLTQNGHMVVVIHFKRMSIKPASHILQHSECYQTVSSHCKTSFLVNQWCSDVTPWSVGEVKILGNLLEWMQPDIVGLSTRSVYFERIHEILSAMGSCKTKQGDKPIVIAGGHDASFRPELYLQRGADQVCIGDGEKAMLDLANGVPPEKINNLYGNDLPVLQCKPEYFRGNDAHHFMITDGRILRCDKHLRVFQNRKYYTMMGKGCLGDCTFCSSGAYNRLHQGYKLRNLRDMDDVIKDCVDGVELGYGQVYLLDSYVVAPRKYLLEFFKEYKKHVELPFFAQMYPEQVIKYPELLDAAVDAGMFSTVSGFQSGSEEINKYIYNRPTPNKTLLKYAQMCTDRGIEVDYHFITHNRLECEWHNRETFDLIGKLPKADGNKILLRPLNELVPTKIYKLTRHRHFDFDRASWWLALLLLKYENQDIEFEDYKDKTFEELKEEYGVQDRMASRQEGQL